MSRWWGWWRPIDGKPTVAELQREIEHLADRLAGANREVNRYARQVAGMSVAVDKRERQLAKAQAQRDLLARQLEQVAAVLAEGLPDSVCVERIAQVLMEGGGDG